MKRKEFIEQIEGARGITQKMGGCMCGALLSAFVSDSVANAFCEMFRPYYDPGAEWAYWLGCDNSEVYTDGARPEHAKAHRLEVLNLFERIMLDTGYYREF